MTFDEGGQITVRQATIEDLGKLVPLFDAYRRFYGEHSDVDVARRFLAERFRHHESAVFLAVDSHDEAAGFVQVYPMFSSVSARRTYILNDLFVTQAARRRGVASLLLRRAAEFGRAMGAVRLSLSTALTNQAGQKLYESLGWERDEAFCHYDLTL